MIAQCDFTKTGYESYTCSRCGTTLEIPGETGKIHRECSVQVAGLGDTLANFAGKIGIKRKKGCGCSERQSKLNEIFPYKKPEPQNKPPGTIIDTDGNLVVKNKSKQKRWAYGITTVPERKDDLFPRTLASLREAGFDKPRIFVDGCSNPYENDYELFASVDMITVRYPKIRTAGHWVLSLYELYIREPQCHYYAIFQDDFITYKNLRQYLERCKYPDKGYWNLYTFPINQTRAPKEGTGWYLSNQMGKGAVALIFSRDAVVELLSARHMTERPMDPKRGWRAVDGGIVTAMKKAGWQEWVHNPSLVQHTGEVSALGNRPHPQATSFRGIDYNAMDMLSEAPECSQIDLATT